MAAPLPNQVPAGKFPRLSDRFSVDDLVVTWIVPNNRRLLGRKSMRVDMNVMDLSVAGALVLGPSLDSVRSGSRVPIVYDGEQGLVEIRHVRHAGDVPGAGEASYYGVVFLNLTPKLKELIFERMQARRGQRDPELTELWNHAR